MGTRQQTAKSAIESMHALGCSNPDPNTHREEAYDKVGSDLFIHEQGGKQYRCEGIGGHGVGHACRTCALECKHPQNKGERSPANSQVSTGNPLPRAKVSKRADTIRGETSEDEHRRTASHSNRQEAQRTRSLQ